MNSDKLLVGVVVVVLSLFMGLLGGFFSLRLCRLTFILTIPILWGCLREVSRKVDWDEGSSILKVLNVGWLSFLLM